MRIADIRMGVEAYIGAAVLQPVHPRQCIKPAVSGMSAAEMTEYGRIILSGFAVVDAHVPVAVTALARIGYVIVIPLHRPVIDAHRFIQRADRIPGTLVAPFHILFSMCKPEIQCMVGVELIRSRHAAACFLAVVPQGRFEIIRPVLVLFPVLVRHTADSMILVFRVDRQDIPFRYPGGGLEAPYLSRIAAQVEIGRQRACLVGAEIAGTVIPSFRIKLQARFVLRRLRNDVDHAADGIGTVLGARRTADNFDTVDIFRPHPQKLISVAGILRHISQHGLPVDKDQRMPRIGSADGDTHLTHGVYGACNTDFVEYDVFRRFPLFTGNVFGRNDRRSLRFVLGRFLVRVDLNDNISRFDPIVPPPADCPPHRRAGSAR